MIDRAASNPAVIDPSLDSRAVSFENPGRRRGAPAGRRRRVARARPTSCCDADERVVLGDIDGPGIVRHIWLTVPSAPPEQLRSLILEVFYDGADEPSISVPVLDFFGAAPRPAGRLRIGAHLDPGGPGLQLVRADAVPRPHPPRAVERRARAPDPLLPDRLHAAGRAARRPRAAPRHLPPREPDDAASRTSSSPTACAGPGRFLGCNVGVRVIDDGDWYGEGEVKVYRDGDTELPTICGTGLEDYVGSAWGLGRFHSAYSRRAAGRRPRGATPSPWAPSPTWSASTAGTCPTRSCSSATCG